MSRVGTVLMLFGRYSIQIQCIFITPYWKCGSLSYLSMVNGTRWLPIFWSTYFVFRDACKKKKSLIFCLLKTMSKSPPPTPFVFKTSKMSDFFGWFFPQFNKKIAHFWVFEDNFDLAAPLPPPCLEKTKNEWFFFSCKHPIFWY